MPGKWIYLSPHFDDAVLSAGGLIWEQVRQGNQVEIWTMCGGEAPVDQPLSDFARSLHSTWHTGETATQTRAQEDIRACQLLGTTCKHLSWPDCIYRYDPQTGKPFVQREEDLFKPYSQAERDELLHLLSGFTFQEGTQVVVPFGIGNHRDHMVVRAVAEQLYGITWHYPDYPYVVQKKVNPLSLIPKSSIPLKQLLTEGGLVVWKDAIDCFQSQLPVFWKDVRSMHAAVDEYASMIKSHYDNTFLWRF